MPVQFPARVPAIDAPFRCCYRSTYNKPGQEIMAKATNIRSIETLACDAGWRNYHFVKLTTDDGIVGWSEFDEGFGSPGVGAVIERLAARVVGQDVGEHERIYAELYCATRPAAGGVVAQAHRRHRERAARRQGQGARRALLRAARRQDARPHPRLLVALRDLAHQSPDYYKPAITDLDGVKAIGREVREKRLHRAEDQHLHLRRDGKTARAGGPASARRSIPSSTSTATCCATCACISRRSATAPGPTSTCCSTSTSTPRPRAI